MASTIYSPNVCAALVRVAASFGKVSVESVIDGSAAPISATYSADGRGMRNGWHSGDEADAVYVERHDLGVCVFHGFIDSVSRKLVQAG